MYIFSIFPFLFFDIFSSNLAMLLQWFVTPTGNLTDFASFRVVSPGFAHVAGVCGGAVETVKTGGVCFHVSGSFGQIRKAYTSGKLTAGT